MSFKFQILGTSSSGNCSVLKTPACTVLIDAGFSGKKIRRGLGDLGIAFSRIDAVFFTHEHRDHSAGIPGITASEHCPHLFANKGTAGEINRRYNKEKMIGWNIFENGTTFEFKDLKVTPFSVPHDAQDTCGYVFECAGEKLAWMTDCGKITNIARQKLADCDFLVLESNFDPELLNRSARPEELKNRIRGLHGHLSNGQCANFLQEYDNPRLKTIFFGHVSEECNAVEKIRETSLAAVSSRNIRAEIICPTDFMPDNGGFGF